jgi:hypothetical protein
MPCSTPTPVAAGGALAAGSGGRSLGSGDGFAGGGAAALAAGGPAAADGSASRSHASAGAVAQPKSKAGPSSRTASSCHIDDRAATRGVLWRAAAMRTHCALALIAAGCAASRAPAAVAPGGADPTSDAGAPAMSVDGAAPVSTADGGTQAAVSGPSLPELVVETIGLHVGGGTNDAAQKQPFERAVARQFAAFRRCYLEVERPEAGGTFGVDLFIASGGGRPEVRDARTGMRGTAFRECVRAAFASVEFEPPGRPTVISYSLRFRLAD